MSFSDSQIGEMWWANYRQALDALGVEWSTDEAPSDMDAILIEVGAHPKARRAADDLTKRLVNDEQAWRRYTNARANARARPGRLSRSPRQVAAPTKRRRRSESRAELARAERPARIEALRLARPVSASSDIDDRP